MNWPQPPGHALVGVVFILLGVFITAIGLLVAISFVFMGRGWFRHASLGTPLEFGLLLVVGGGVCVTFGRRMKRGGMQ